MLTDKIVAEADREQRIDSVLTEFATEAARALAKHGAAQTMDGPSKTDGDRLAILMEEVGEVAHELTYDQKVVEYKITKPRSAWAPPFELIDDAEGTMLLVQGAHDPVRITEFNDAGLASFGIERVTNIDKLRKELIQVGAMAATWAAMLR